jgi:glycosyltransferase involved in cell wall biosynthesis
MKILIVCPYPFGKAPSQRFRFEQYLEYLDAEFEIASFWKEDEWPGIYRDSGLIAKIFQTARAFFRRFILAFTLSKYQKVFIHREATPIGPPWFEWLLAKVFRIPFVFDFDDAIWLPNSSEANAKMVQRFKNHGKTAKICGWAKTVTVGNDFLANYASQFATDVRIIPTTIDTENHHNPALLLESSRKDSPTEKDPHNRPPSSHRPSPNTQYPVTERRFPSGAEGSRGTIPNTQYPIPNTKQPTIGWTGSHSTLKQLTPLFPILEEIHKEEPFRFLLIADQPPAEMPRFVEFREWNKDNEIKDLSEMDIGIMPLYDSEWEKGKCGFKALQYMALEIPAVVSPVGVNAEIVQDQLQGYHAENMPPDASKIWRDRLLTLLRDPALRQKMGKAGRKRVEDNYSVNSQKEAYREVFLK